MREKEKIKIKVKHSLTSTFAKHQASTQKMKFLEQKKQRMQ